MCCFLVCAQVTPTTSISRQRANRGLALVANFKEKYVQGFKPSNIWLGAHVVHTNCCDFRRAQVCLCDFTPVYHFQIPCSAAGAWKSGIRRRRGSTPYGPVTVDPSFEVSGFGGGMIHNLNKWCCNKPTKLQS